MQLLKEESKQEDQPVLLKDPKSVAVLVKDFGEMFGRDYRWANRLVTTKRIKSIEGWGSTLIPLTEVDVILNTARKESI